MAEKKDHDRTPEENPRLAIAQHVISIATDVITRGQTPVAIRTRLKHLRDRYSRVVSEELD